MRVPAPLASSQYSSFRVFGGSLFRRVQRVIFELGARAGAEGAAFIAMVVSRRKGVS